MVILKYKSNYIIPMLKIFWPPIIHQAWHTELFKILFCQAF